MREQRHRFFSSELEACLHSVSLAGMISGFCEFSEVTEMGRFLSLADNMRTTVSEA